LVGSNSAKLNAAIGDIPATIATIIKGKIILIPKTAIAIPRVKNLCCRLAVIFLSMVALTTALSKERDTSRTQRMSTIIVVSIPAAIFIVGPAHKKNAPILASTENTNDHLKYFIYEKNYTVK